MYMPFLMYGYAVALVMMLLACRVASRTVPGMRGIRLLSCSLGCALLTVILFALRPWAPAWMTVLLANQAYFACSLLVYCAVADTLSIPMRFLPWGVALALAAFPACAWFTWIHPSLVARILITGCVCAVISAATASILFRRGDPPADETAPALRSAGTALGWLQVLTLLAHTLRCVLTLLQPPADFVHLDLIQAGFTWLILLVAVGTGCGLIWLSLCVQRRDLHTLAQTDALTGLLNRRAFDAILSRELGRYSYGRRRSSLLLLDIDRFKEVNDSLGHMAGDEVIRRVSAVLRGSTRAGDALARYGGEEFVLLLRDSSLEQSEQIAERLRADIAALPRLPDGRALTASIGLAASQPGDTPEELLRRCDLALYGSKRGGRNRVTADRSPAPPMDVSIQPA